MRGANANIIKAREATITLRESLKDIIYTANALSKNKIWVMRCRIR